MPEPTTDSPAPPPVTGTIAFDQVEPARFRQVLQTWFALRRDGLIAPPVESLDPFVVPSLVPHIILLEVEPGAFRYRVVGGKVQIATTGNPVGRTVRDVVGDGGYHDLIRAQFRIATEQGDAIYSRHHFRRPKDGRSVRANRILMPYGDGERVTRLLAYQLLDEITGDRLPEGRELMDLLPRTVFRVAPPP